MNRYIVSVTETWWGKVEVEAGTEHEAYEKARAIVNEGDGEWISEGRTEIDDVKLAERVLPDEDDEK
jgi:hypothetical protein